MSETTTTELDKFTDRDGDILLVHYSDNLAFSPSALETVPGFGAGCFFYPLGAELPWPGRERSTWYAPAQFVEFVQDFDDDGGYIVEVFVAAENLHLVQATWPA